MQNSNHFKNDYKWWFLSELFITSRNEKDARRTCLLTLIRNRFYEIYLKLSYHLIECHTRVILYQISQLVCLIFGSWKKNGYYKLKHLPQPNCFVFIWLFVENLLLNNIFTLQNGNTYMNRVFLIDFFNTVDVGKI